MSSSAPYSTSCNVAASLDRTLVIITSDHGEGLGEHDLFMHGESLYRTEIRVPLLILPPSRRPSGAVVRQTVSLRDLPATIVDLIGLGDGSPFPGRSLARFWADRPAGCPPVEAEAALSELGVAQPVGSQPGPVARLSRPADLPGRGGFRLHPQ